jgi:hypothetical protein
MKKTKGLLVAATALSMLVGASAIADSRHRDETRGRYESQRGVTMEGRVRRVSPDRDGYRVELDRGGYAYYVPSSALRGGRGGRGLDLRVGVSVRLYGTYDPRGYINVSSCDSLDDNGGYYGSNDGYRDDGYRDDGYRNDGYRNDGYRNDRNRDRESFVSGVIDRIDDRRGVAELRDARSRRRITIVMRRSDDRRNRSIDLNDLRRGDTVTFAGSWGRSGTFEAWRIDGVNSRRW